MRNVKGITLIALVITIVVLVILAGVAISLAIGENGLLNKAKYAKEEYKLAQAREELELEILQVQTKIMEEEGRTATLEDLQNLIDTSKYEIVLYYTPIASNEETQVKATYSKVKEISSGIIFVVDSKLVIRDVEIIDKDESSKINNFEISIENANGSYLTINASGATTNDESTIQLYKYYVNGEKIQETAENTYTVTDLELNTEYSIKVIAIDEDGKEKASSIKKYTTDSKQYLYKEGDTCDTITGGWRAAAIGCGNTATVVTPALQFNSNYMNISLPYQSVMSGGSVVLNKEIDFSNYNKVCVSLTGTASYYNAASALQLFKNSKNVQTYPTNVIGGIGLNDLLYTEALTTKTVKEIDLSQENDIEDIYFYIQTGPTEGSISCQIYEVWLEK